ncbi:uncharacterized protein LOC144114419 isoform X1 [Amblyomma americanum]
MDEVWSSLSPVFLISVVTSALALVFTAVFAYRTSKYGFLLGKNETRLEPNAVGSCVDELSDEENERIPAKPQAAKAAESLIEAAMTEEQKTMERERQAATMAAASKPRSSSRSGSSAPGGGTGRAQQKQLEEIYRLMAEHSDKFGSTSMEEIVNQMALYR